MQASNYGVSAPPAGGFQNGRFALDVPMQSQYLEASRPTYWRGLGGGCPPRIIRGGFKFLLENPSRPMGAHGAMGPHRMSTMWPAASMGETDGFHVLLRTVQIEITASRRCPLVAQVDDVIVDERPRCDRETGDEQIA